MFTVGLTGNIASGKSTVAAFFKAQGIDVLSADAIARELTAKGKLALAEIKAHFGENILTVHKELDRKALRQIIFNNPKERRWLENYLHPQIREQLLAQLKLCKSPYCLIEIPLLKNRQNYPYLNRVLAVLAKKSLQIARLLQRDAASTAQAQAILAAQPSDFSREALADDIIFNNGSLEDLQASVLVLHQLYLKSS